MIILRSPTLLPPAVPALRLLRKAVVAGAALAFTAGAAAAPAAEGAKPAASAVPPAAETSASPGPAELLAKEQQASRDELSKLSQAITLSEDKVAELEAEIASLGKDQATIRSELVDAADRQKELQQKLSDDEKKLTALHLRQDAIHANLKARRGVFAEVLGALERMGRNPPPALLVTPNDALASVRSAILLGAVVPEMRQETHALVTQLQALADVREAIGAEKAQMVATLTKIAAERKRLSLLMEEKKRLQSENQSRLAAERQHSEQLAAKADNLNELIASLEARITSARQEAAQAREA
jgi:septal ring factor EnvC (AmiA/AmiB activator)